MRLSNGKPLFVPAMLLASCGTTSSSPPQATDAGQEDAGWSQCSSPEGLTVCAGPYRCNEPGCDCLLGTDQLPGACSSDAVQGFGLKGYYCHECLDGQICVILGDDISPNCGPYNLGVLFAQNGAPDHVHYADFGK